MRCPRGQEAWRGAGRVSGRPQYCGNRHHDRHRDCHDLERQAGSAATKAVLRDYQNKIVKPPLLIFVLPFSLRNGRFWRSGHSIAGGRILCSIIPGFALVSIATIHAIFRADRPCANCNSVTCAELSSVRGSGPPPRCSRSRCRSPCSSRQHLLRQRLRRLRVSARRRAVPRCRR